MVRSGAHQAGGKLRRHRRSDYSGVSRSVASLSEIKANDL
jgi:hypothetical protein